MKKIEKIKRLILLPIKNPSHNLDGEHYWEIGKAGYSLNRIINDIQKAGFKIEKTYKVFEHPHHGFLY